MLLAVWAWGEFKAMYMDVCECGVWEKWGARESCDLDRDRI